MLEARVLETHRNIVAISMTTLVLSGCLLQEDVTDGEEDVSTAATVESEYALSGSVGDGPVVGAAMRVLQNDGVILKEFQSDSSAGYNTVVRTKGRYYPLTVDATGGIDLVTNQAPDFTLMGAALEPSKKYVVNVNPYSTVVMEMARDLEGGRTKSNIYKAQDILAASWDFGLRSFSATGPMTAEITSSNVAEIVKSSEAIGEVVRRTRDWLLTAGYVWDGNNVVRALGSDLIDGVIDGRGGPRVNSRLAAIANLVIVQVLLESAANELHVNGVNATATLEMAIDEMNLGTASPSLAELTATAGMLDHVDIGLDAADAISDDQSVTDLKSSTSGLQAGLQPMLAKSVLPPDYRETLDDVIWMMLTSGDTTMIDTVNGTVRDGADPPSEPPPDDPPTPVETIVDNLDQNTVRSGTWQVSTAASPYLGNSEFCEIGCLFTWRPVLPTSGTYEVYVYWTYYPQRTTSALYQIDHIGGTGTTVVDQRNSSTSNQWYLIGTFELTAGVNGNVSLSYDETESGVSVSADAVRYVLVNEGPPADPNNTPPTISGTPPATVTKDTLYDYTPVAADGDNDPLTFSIIGKPSWATFNSVTGRLSGTPGDQHVGTYSGIVISVSDGQASADLGPFSVTVQATSLGSATLIWQPPTENEDGTPLTDLAGYKIYWGTNPGDYPNSVTLNNPGLTTYVVENLSPGTYEFVATAINGSGVESRFSNAASKTVQ